MEEDCKGNRNIPPHQYKARNAKVKWWGKDFLEAMKLGKR